MKIATSLRFAGVLATLLLALFALLFVAGVIDREQLQDFSIQALLAILILAAAALVVSLLLKKNPD